MIKAENRMNGIMVSIEGSTVDVIIELTGIIQSVYEMFKGRYDDDFAKETIAMCGKLAFAEDDETKHSIIDRVSEALLKKGESK